MGDSGGQLPFGLDHNSIKPGAVRSMTSDKLASFSLGMTKKTPFQKHQEAKAAKRKAEEEAAKAEMQQWVETFESADQPKKFVRGGVMEQGNDTRAPSSSGAAPPAKMWPGSSAAKPKEPSAAAKSMFAVEEDIDGEAIDGEPLSAAATAKGGSQRIPAPVIRRKEAPPPPPAAPLRKKQDSRMSQMAAFMEELRQEQEERENRGERDSDKARMEPSVTSFDNQDPETTNLYVGNLAPEITEELLFREFAKFGPIQSVKIMWPRSEEEKARARHCGFVAFVNRNDAAAAKDALNDTELRGQIMRIGWGKAVSKPAPALTLASIQAQAAGYGSAIAATLPPGLCGSAAREAISMGLSSAAPPVAPKPSLAAATPSVPVVVPEKPMRELIDRLAAFVAAMGHQFEQAIMEREQRNPQYSFMFDSSAAEHLYYRWKVVSLCIGEAADAWDTAPFRLEAGGVTWTPPPCSRPPARRVASRSPSCSSSSSRSPSPRRRREQERDRDREWDRRRDLKLDERRERLPPKDHRGERELTEEERDELEDMLRGLLVERQKIKECMGFCISKAAASAEIVETVTEALTLSETPVPKKIARLFLVSDVLHNSSALVPHASSYRSRFQETLPQIFKSLHDTSQALTSRMSIETMKDSVVKVLHIWQAWSLFPPSFVTRLERILLHGSADPKTSNASAAGGGDDSEDVDGEAIESGDDDVDGEPMPEEPPKQPPAAAPSAAAVNDREQKLRALTLREVEAVCEANSISTIGSRAEMLQRIFLALRAGIDLNLDAPVQEQQTLAVATRWDDDDVDGTPIDAPAAASPATADDVDGEPLPPAPSATREKSNDAQEQSLPKETLRELEGKLMEFTDSLDPLGKSSEWVASRVAEQRKKLVAAALEAMKSKNAEGRRSGTEQNKEKERDRSSDRARDGERERSRDLSKERDRDERERGREQRDRGTSSKAVETDKERRAREKEERRVREAREKAGKPTDDRHEEKERRSRKERGRSSSSDSSDSRGRGRKRRR